jgi:hypothetical protein
MTATELHPCAGGCGEMVRGTWKRGHKARFDAHGTCARSGLLPGPDATDDDWKNLGQRLGLLPGPDATDDDLDDFDLGLVGPPPPPGSDTDLEDDDDEIRPDPPPGHVSTPDRRKGRPAQGHRVRVTATIRKDIHAKIQFILVPAGKLWAVRDPACGPVFIEQEPEISDALTDIVCDSADLVAFFTGPAGGFMKYLNLMAAVAPVGQMIYMHHIAHTVTLEPVDRQTVDPARYAA